MQATLLLLYKTFIASKIEIGNVIHDLLPREDMFKICKINTSELRINF
jgi:hypothetical protein